MNLRKNALEILQKTSRTFYIPISRLPKDLLEAVASAYLCMRAIDEIEDHGDLDNSTKAKLLRTISLNLQSGVENSKIEDFSAGLQSHALVLPEVTYRVGEWAILSNSTIAPRIWDATAAMAERMAYWAEINWKIETKCDLDRYTFSVAGAVGLLLSDLWAWYDGDSDRSQLCNWFWSRFTSSKYPPQPPRRFRSRSRFFSSRLDGAEDMQDYARYNLSLADTYTKSLPKGPALDFCQIPLTLAHGTLDVLALGRAKLSRSEVIALVHKVTK